MKKVLIGLSGGIDSTYSAYLLKKRGYQVEGLYLKLHGREEYFRENIEKVEKVAKFLDIPLHILDLQDEFSKKVYRPFVDTYIEGKTPNPCVVCNREIKFGEMLKFAEKIGADYLATGHYVRHDGKFLLEAKDSSKDQSYFLFYINREAVPKLLFPLGDYLKSEIKEEISKIPELTQFATQKESNEICFVEKSYIDVIGKHHNTDIEGEVVNSKGEIIGKHRGYMHYTIGKRRGFTLKVAHEPHYVIDIIPERNQIVVGKREELARWKVSLENLNMFIDDREFEANVKLRYRSRGLRCKVQILDNRAEIELFEPIYGLAKGQAGVFYRDGKVLGGGWIT
ncbi:MAG TPA: tRNA 2-thiouridine(34) synthase MnmA [Campylobacterales bacterium]|nr:tRNA 2-thiouridine(34) synthase MnmA [Campylobacterales bacterium]